MLSLVVLLAALAVCGHAHSDLRITLELRQSLKVPHGWVSTGQAKSDEEVSLVFAVKHSNTDRLEELFWEVSTPGRKLYRQFLSHSDLNQLIAPKPESIDQVQTWLSGVGVKIDEQCRWTQAREFLRCDVPCFLAEALLGVTFEAFHHQTSGMTAVRTTEHYTVPIAVSSHLDFVGGVHRFPPVPKANVANSNVSSLVDLQTPNSLRERYKVGSTVAGKSPTNIQAVAQFLKQHYSSTDLKEFFTLIGKGFQHRSDVDKVIGPNTFPSGGEANLDVQYIMSMGANATTWFWSTAGYHDKQEPFLVWMMDVANYSTIPQVMSVSYGDEEDTLSIDYMTRTNQEFQKQGLRGMSLLFASGDAGANCKQGTLYPFFPASSPYVTTVGGTEGFLAVGTEKAALLSSGGFSNVFPRPSYQAADVANYLSTGPKIPTAAFNHTGRGFPDVAAMAMDFMIVDELIPQPVDGTSCATPTFAGIISLVNDALLASGKSPLGFLNPFLYQHASTLLDITEQCSGGCLNTGWCAAKGWDAVTGLGTPNFELLLKAAVGA